MDASNGKKEQLRGYVWVCGRVHDRKLRVFARGGKRGEREGRARPRVIRLGGRREFSVKRGATSVQGSHGKSERGRGEGESEGLGWRKWISSC